MKKLVYISGDNDYSVITFEDHFGGKTLTELKEIGKDNGHGLELTIKDTGDDWLDGTIIYVREEEIVMDEDAIELLKIINAKIDYDASKHSGHTLIEE